MEKSFNHIPIQHAKPYGGAFVQHRDNGASAAAPYGFGSPVSSDA